MVATVRVDAVSTPDHPDPTLHAFGMHLRQLREAQGLTLEELAGRSGMSFRGVVYIEHGRRNPSLITILSLARGLGIDPSLLLSVFDAPSP
ncbi:helix-turn-helix transcriptional regulator [Streptomyces sp. NPDC005500]|uniref:helix-turn-helix domain-containing protein n=2 Tax=unclassified Streptomyces TaxID=2593676 RepID=UPI0033BDC152